jgi:hypothetical protein
MEAVPVSGFLKDWYSPDRVLKVNSTYPPITVSKSALASASTKKPGLPNWKTSDSRKVSGHFYRHTHYQQAS